MDLVHREHFCLWHTLASFPLYMTLYIVMNTGKGTISFSPSSSCFFFPSAENFSVVLCFICHSASCQGSRSSPSGAGSSTTESFFFFLNPLKENNKKHLQTSCMALQHGHQFFYPLPMTLFCQEGWLFLELPLPVHQLSVWRVMQKGTEFPRRQPGSIPGRQIYGMSSVSGHVTTSSRTRKQTPNMIKEIRDKLVAHTKWVRMLHSAQCSWICKQNEVTVLGTGRQVQMGYLRTEWANELAQGHQVSVYK